MAKRKKTLKAHLPAILGGAVLLVLVVLAVRFIIDLQDQPARVERKIQPITLAPPPPPPPPPKVERPPEPKIEEHHVEEQQAEPEPEEPIPDVADQPPPGDLGLDAEGVAGGDGFGLVARKGGRGLFGGGGGSPYAWYGNIIKNDIIDLLGDREELRKKGYVAIVKFWVNPDGSVSRFELARGSNDSGIDELLSRMLSKYTRVNEIPPPGLDQPIKLRITSRL